MYLLDTVVLSELRKAHRDPGVETWIRGVHATDLHVSVVTVGEVERGIARQERVDPAFARRLQDWLSIVLSTYGDRVLPVTTGIARRWGRLAQRVGHSGADLLIAATALDHGLCVVTRNVRHFDGTEVALSNPFRPD